MERFTISIDDHLAQEFDSWIAQRGYANRSEAFRDMVRAEMDRQRVRTMPEGPCVLCLPYVYKHHEHCIETVLLKGPASAVQRFADALCAEKGVLHGKLNLIGVDVHEHHRHEAGGQRHTHVKPIA